MSQSKTAKGTAIKQIEMRRCVVCRQVHHKSELLRVVKSEGKISFDDAVSKVKQSTRNFAKRQLTWYRRMNYIHWFNVR